VPSNVIPKKTAKGKQAKASPKKKDDLIPAAPPMMQNPRVPLSPFTAPNPMQFSGYQMPPNLMPNMAGINYQT